MADVWANSMACHLRVTCHIARCKNDISHIENRFSPYFIIRHSLVERRARYLVYCMFVCLNVCSSTISRQPAGRFMPQFACGRTLVPDLSSPLLGVNAPRGAKKGGNEIFVTIGVDGEFLHFGGF